MCLRLCIQFTERTFCLSCCSQHAAAGREQTQGVGECTGCGRRSQADAAFRQGGLQERDLAFGQDRLSQLQSQEPRQ